MIDLQTEKVVTFKEATNCLQVTPHISTLHRWRLNGIRGVKLETCLIGGKRCTSLEALQRFITATTSAAAGEDEQFSATQSQGDNEASRQLDHLGF